MGTTSSLLWANSDLVIRICSVLDGAELCIVARVASRAGGPARLRDLVEGVAERACQSMSRTKNCEMRWRRVLCHMRSSRVRCERQLQGHTKTVSCVVELRDGRVVSGSADNSLRVWDVGTGQCERQLQGHTDEVSCVVELRDGRVVSGSWDKSLRV